MFCTIWLYYYKMDTKAIVKPIADSDSEDIEEIQEVQIEEDKIETELVKFNIVESILTFILLKKIKELLQIQIYFSQNDIQITMTIIYVRRGNSK